LDFAVTAKVVLLTHKVTFVEAADALAIPIVLAMMAVGIATARRNDLRLAIMSASR
jgi:hypothetical protein